jgi:hypothetical protein
MTRRDAARDVVQHATDSVAERNTVNVPQDTDARRAWCAWLAGEYELLKFFRTYEQADSYARAQREDDSKTWYVGKTIAQFADLEVAQAYALGRLQ